MKTPSEAAMGLRWLAPSAASLTLLAREPLSSVWPRLRNDPGFVLLCARLSHQPDPIQPNLDIPLLESIVEHHADFAIGHVDWRLPAPAAVLETCFRQATLASALATKIDVDSRQAWIAGFLAPLGWLSLAATNAPGLADHVKLASRGNASSDWQTVAWGCDHAALVRRLVRSWRLPAWLGATISNLGLDASLAERLGAPLRLFQTVQYSVLATQETGAGLGLAVGADSRQLASELGLARDECSRLIDDARNAALPDLVWESPADVPLLPDLLRLALTNRRQSEQAWIERLQHELDQAQAALLYQCAAEKTRLHALKVSAMAEFAAGAGHEINNPLAVISGQAQYAIKQLEWLDVSADEIEDVGLYLENLHGKIAPSLHKIVAQTQRIHTILTDLMQFARPQPARLQTLSAHGLIDEVVASLQHVAELRQVRIVQPAWDHDEYLHVDANQARIALSCLVRNALEAAPNDGWASVRIEKRDKKMLDLIVEDNGPGPHDTIREHLFDPFFSGRSAGRGRGLGLPTAWRLARNQGGDARFDGIHDSMTRFVLTLPLAPGPNFTNGAVHEVKVRHAAHALQEAHY